MKIFLSWSGERSRLVAEALKSWLPDVISFFEPWVSSEDIEKGARWGLDLNKQLEGTDIGIICLTPENINAPWILFESGALAKSIDRGRVCTYLFQIQKGDLIGPLVQFQASQTTESDTLKLIKTLNSRLKEKARTDEQIMRIFKQWWPNLKKRLDDIPAKNDAIQDRRSDREILEEVLELARQQVKGSYTFSGYMSYGPIINFINKSEVLRFAKEAQLERGSDDPNASDWTTKLSQKDKLSFLSGTWHSRWFQNPYSTVWYTGTATIMAHQNYWCLIHTDKNFEYIMIGWQDEKGRLLGYHYSIDEPQDRSPWIGIIVNNDRIDGQWKNGRWDLRR